MTAASSPDAGDQAAASEFAALAAEALEALRADPPRHADLGRTGDALSHQLLVRAIHDRYPGDAILSEEAADDPSRLGARRVWIIDPLDGTREFAEAGRRDWAVHVALWGGGRIVAAAVAIPALGLLLGTNEPPPPHAQAGPRRLLVSRTRPPAFAAEVATAIDAELVPMGSAGAKTAEVVLGRAGAYLHAGGQYEWDSAAPVGVALAAGLHASRINGDPLVYNRPDPRIPDLLICRPELAAPLLEAVARGDR